MKDSVFCYLKFASTFPCPPSDTCTHRSIHKLLIGKSLLLSFQIEEENLLQSYFCKYVPVHFCVTSSYCTSWSSDVLVLGVLGFFCGLIGCLVFLKLC